MLVYLRLSGSRSCPSLGWPSRLLGHPLGFQGPYRPEEKFSNPCPLCGKRVRSAREDKPFSVILVGKDRDHWRVSHDVTRRCVVVVSEIEAYGCPSCIYHPYKTTGFAPRVLYFTFLPSHHQPPPPIARASCTRIAVAVKLASASQPPLNSHPPHFPSFQWSRGADPPLPLSA